MSRLFTIITSFWLGLSALGTAGSFFIVGLIFHFLFGEMTVAWIAYGISALALLFAVGIIWGTWTGAVNISPSKDPEKGWEFGD